MSGCSDDLKNKIALIRKPNISKSCFCCIQDYLGLVNVCVLVLFLLRVSAVNIFIQSPHISSVDSLMRMSCNRVTGLISFSHPQVADLWSVLQPHGECPEETGRANSHTGRCQD